LVLWGRLKTGKKGVWLLKPKSEKKVKAPAMLQKKKRCQKGDALSLRLTEELLWLPRTGREGISLDQKAGLLEEKGGDVLKIRGERDDRGVKHHSWDSGQWKTAKRNFEGKE